jgi:NitT/TauT family transport system ATP-binding protein
MSLAISVNAVSHTYNDEPVLADITFDIERGQFVSLVGASGCGKSTLMKIIGGIVRPSGGTVLLDGRELGDAVKGHAFGFVFQNPVMLPWRTVAENIRLPLEIVGPASSSPGEIEELLSLVGLETYGSYYPTALSGGMKQRVALARALSFNPSVLLMDEPFAALDEISRDKLNLELMRIWQDTQKTVIFVTHSIPEAVFLSDEVILLSGRPATIGAVREINLPRPRQLDVKRSDQYYEHILWLRNVLKE